MFRARNLLIDVDVVGRAHDEIASSTSQFNSASSGPTGGDIAVTSFVLSTFGWVDLRAQKLQIGVDFVGLVHDEDCIGHLSVHSVPSWPTGGDVTVNSFAPSTSRWVVLRARNLQIDVDVVGRAHDEISSSITSFKCDG